MKRWRFLLVCLLLFFAVGTASAREIIQGDECVIEAEDVMTGDVFVLCRLLTINGRIEGTLIGGAINAVINGEIEGNVYLAAGQLDIHSSIEGDLHFAGAVLNIHGSREETTLIDGELIAASLSLNLQDHTRLSGGIVNLGYQLLVDGDVTSDVSFWGSALVISGGVQGDIDATVADPESDASQIETLLLPLPFEAELVNPGLVVTADGHIDGQLRYTGPVAGIIEGELAQEAIFTPTPIVPVLPLEEPGSLRIYFQQVMSEFWTLLIIGVLGLTFIPRVIKKPIPNLRLRPVSSFSVGMLAFILSFPIVLIGVLLSLLVVIILAVLRLDTLTLITGVFLGVANIGGASLFYFMALAVSRVMVCLVWGRWIVRIFIRLHIESTRLTYLSLLVGVSLLSILASIPAVGWIFNAAVLFMGLGAILMATLEYFSAVRVSTASMYTPSPYAQARQLPRRPRELPSIDITPPSRAGMDDLPKGFDFSFFEDD